MPPSSVDLYLVRHAHAGDPARWTGDDARRPLSAKGRLQADTVARHLVSLAVDLDVIITSPLVRARQTADTIARALDMAVQVEDRVAQGLSMSALERVLADAGDPGAALVVGHDPDFSDLLANLAGAGSIPFRKGAIARFEARRPLRAGDAILRWLIPPDALVQSRAAT